MESSVLIITLVLLALTCGAALGAILGISRKTA